MGRIWLTAFLFVTPGLFAEGWVLARQSNGITVYNRSVPGSAVRELRGEVTVQSRLSGLVALFQDMQGYPLWYDSLKNTRLLRRLGPLVLIGYAEVDFPWPASNRDMILRYSFTQDPRTRVVRVRLHNMPDYLPRRPGIVRLLQVKGSWEFRPLPGGSVRVIMQTHSEPGGSIPEWISDAAVTTAPLRALDGLRRRIKGPRYQERCFAGIVEPGGEGCGAAAGIPPGDSEARPSLWAVENRVAFLHPRGKEDRRVSCWGRAGRARRWRATQALP